MALIYAVRILFLFKAVLLRQSISHRFFQHRNTSWCCGCGGWAWPSSLSSVSSTGWPGSWSRISQGKDDFYAVLRIRDIFGWIHIRIRIHTSDWWIRIRIQEAEKHVDPVDPDPARLLLWPVLRIGFVLMLIRIRLSIFDADSDLDLFPSSSYTKVRHLPAGEDHGPGSFKVKTTFMQRCGSMTFWGGSGSGSADPRLWLMDPDPAIFVIDLPTMPTKN
jgi:hypothetical protein